MTSSLPAGWAVVKLGEVVSPRSGKVAPSAMPDAPFIGLENVEAHSGRIIYHGRTGDMKSNVAVFQPGDVLYSRLRPYLKNVVIAPRGGGASAEFIVFPPSQAIWGNFSKPV